MSVVDKETTCGISSWRPRFLQPLASKKVYMIFYGALGIIQGMFFTYLSATLSTIEKKFGIKSKEAAYIMSGNEISQILFLFAMPFMVKVKRRPLWTSIGLGCTALGCFMMAIPHLTSDEYSTVIDNNPGKNSSTAGLCGSAHHPNSLEYNCDESGQRRVDWAGLVIVFLGIVLTGVGNCAFYSFGVAYLDDNTSHENSPIMLGITYTFRLLGPTLGFFLGSFCLKTYVNPGVDPGFSEGDPRWVGAWWLGYPIIGALVVLFAVPLACFPQRLPKKGTDAHLRQTEETLKKDSTDGGVLTSHASFRLAMVRLLKNKLFMYNFFSSIFYVFAFMGFGTFMPKYIEYVFRKRGSTSSSYAGSVGTVSKALGLLVSGFVVSRFKPSARLISGYNVFLGLMYFIALIIFSFLGCPTSTVYGTVGPNGDTSMASNCNVECACPVSRLQPVCSKDGVTNFYSPCYAGCKVKSSFTPKRSMKDKDPPKPITVYEDCSCVHEAWTKANTSLSRQWVKNDLLKEWDFPSEESIDLVSEKIQGDPISGAFSGWCPVECEGFFKTYMICMFILMVLGSTGRIGNVLVALRCIEVQDKSLSMAFNVVFMSLFAMLPAPMVYGAIIDNTCILWQEECGQTTNCLLYDTVRLRRVLMLTTAFIMLVGVAFDVAVWYYSKDLLIFNPEQKQSKEKEEDEVTKHMEQYASNASIAKGSMFLNGAPMTSS